MSTVALQGFTAEDQKTPSREQRYNDLVLTYLDDIYRYACWLTKDKTVADDIVQETMLRAWKSIDRLKEPKAAKGWLITILRRENARRFERIQPKFSDVPTETIGEKCQSYDTSTEAFTLRRAIEKLAKEYREPLLLQVLHGFSQKEIAKKLGITPAGAGTRLFRAKQQMRELLKP